MPILKALHILSMFAAVTFLVSESIFASVAIWRGDVRALAALRRYTGSRPVVGASLFLVGIAFGLLTVATGGFDFLAGWLIAAYVLVVVLLAISALPVVQKGLRGLTDKALEAEAGQRPIEEVVRDMAVLRGSIAAVVATNVVLFAALILDMVLKPF
jgi:hypothetical protein